MKSWVFGVLGISSPVYVGIVHFCVILEFLSCLLFFSFSQFACLKYYKFPFVLTYFLIEENEDMYMFPGTTFLLGKTECGVCFEKVSLIPSEGDGL